MMTGDSQEQAEQVLERLYSEQIAPKLLELEPKRKRAQKIIYASILPVIIVVLGWILIAGVDKLSGATFWTAFIPFMMVIGWGYSAYNEYRSGFKTQVVERMVETMFPGFDYKSAECISAQIYKSSQIFTKGYDRYRGEDYVKGLVGKTTFAFSELHTEYKTETTDSKGRRRTNWHTIFKGIFFHADFNKHTTARTFVMPDVAENAFGSLIGGMLQKASSAVGSHGKLVKLENVEFEKKFVVYSDDQQEARYILTPKIMEDMLVLYNRLKYKPHFAFINGQVFLALSTYVDHFEPRLFGECVNFNDVESYYSTVKRITHIIDELDLNTRIWTKQ